MPEEIDPDMTGPSCDAVVDQIRNRGLRRIAEAAQSFKQRTRRRRRMIEKIRLILRRRHAHQAACRPFASLAGASASSICRFSDFATAKPSKGGTALPICLKAAFMAPAKRKPSGKD